MSNYTAREQKIRDAANKLLAESGVIPSVSAVRKVAGVSMQAVNDVLSVWRKEVEKTVQAEPVEIPDALKNEGLKAIQSVWITAQNLANELLEAARKGWEMDLADFAKNAAEMALDFDEKSKELAEVKAEVKGLQDALGAAEKIAEAATTRVLEAEAEIRQLEKQNQALMEIFKKPSE